MDDVAEPRNSRRQLLTYAFVAKSLREHEDILMGLAPLFESVLHDMDGQIFSADAFVTLSKAKLGVSLTSGIVEEFIPRFHKLGWLKTGERQNSQVVYSITAPHRSPDVEEIIRRLGTQLDQIVKKFVEFTNDLSTVVDRPKDENELAELLIHWLVRQSPKAQLEIPESPPNGPTGNDEASSQPQAITASENSQKRMGDYLCARFIGELHRTDSTLFDQLAEIASVALITEIVADLRTPPQRSRRVRELTVFLDAPFLMDYLDLSGRARHENADYIVSRLKEMGASISVIDHSCEEAKDNLEAVLRLTNFRRTGPTADAILHGELNEAFARAVSLDVVGTAHRKGIRIFRYKTDSHPQDERYFKDEFVEDLGHSFTSWENPIARDRDAKSIAFAMRRRRGTQEVDPFDSKYVLLTRNDLLVKISRRFCIEHQFLNPRHAPPAINSRKMAALLWLTLGGPERIELSRRQLMASCSTVVATRPDLMKNMRELLLAIKPEHKDQINEMLAQPRSVQMAMDIVLGSDQVLSPKQAEEAFQLIRDAESNRVRKEYEQRLSDLNTQMGAELAAKDQTIASRETDLLEAKGQLHQLRAEQIAAILSLMQRAETYGERIAHIIRGAISLVLMAGLVSVTWELVAPIGDLVKFACVAGPALVSGLIVWVSPKKIVHGLAARTRDWRMNRLAERNGLTVLLQHVELKWNPSEVVWHNSHGK